MNRFLASETAERWSRPAVVVLLSGTGWLDLMQHYDVGVGPALMVALLRAVPILGCRRQPLASWLFILAVCTGTALATTPVSRSEPWPWSVTSLGCLLAALAAAGWELTRRTTLIMASGLVLLTAALIEFHDKGDFWPNVLTAAGGVALVVGALEVLRRNRTTQQRLLEQEEISEAERTRRSLLEERARIGRELHDVVAHHMSLIAVQAETAPYRLPDQPDETKAEFRAISAAAREALTDMRKLLGLLRGDAAAMETAPQPSMSEIPALVGSAPDATFYASGSLEHVSTIVGVTAYRVVQESLSNARRHAPGAPVSVEVTRTEQSVRLEIRNTCGTTPPAGTASDEGLGLVGMRERVHLLDGDFSAGRTADGGFAVVAVLPVTS